ncbi:UPF0184 protein AAEL002161 [Tribolium castaneum]|uniref:UPF0184 protein AAEL002161-like Protein n=1 Tax=Tribolium castaneum TaxID=7070 RepID=D6WK35_TRICA|nr:PREDICTED: UPF0184 protein AAEL002161 [Tribolium castaneum]EFA03621.1 UPF0184 protein AAEL002161-like Protein [Tribolium castaneum]|eukprot:XP_001809029.1 PREDICTED: UPF0184 protein AAEL002161 [Tribolium castaneum]
MGEKAHLPHENGLNKNSPEPPDQEMHSDEETGDDLDDMSPEEFQMLDSQLDALNSALDNIEQKNDDIHAQLLLLLQSNREIRQQIQESSAAEKQEPDTQNQ